MNVPKRANLLAASVTAATLVGLSVCPLTREALRFDGQLMAGRPVLQSLLVDLGIRQDALPLGGIGPWNASRPDQSAQDHKQVEQEVQASAPQPALSLALADAMQRSGRDKWRAMQQLVAAFPDSPVAHAALTRIACKNGGSVGVGHDADQMQLTERAAPAPKVPPAQNPDRIPDARIMLCSCTAGEQLDPDNAYFPAMAAIAHYALGQDEAAHAALHRAAAKPHWREYFEVEASGRMRRAELLHGPQNSLTETVTLAGILFPQYATLRALARVATFQAMQSEQQGNVAAGLALRRDVARVGAKLQEQSSTLIGNLVGASMVSATEQRPGGAPVLAGEPDEQQTDAKRTHAHFVTFLRHQGTRADEENWERYTAAGNVVRTTAQHASLVSVFDGPAVLQTQLQLLTNLLLLSTVCLLCVLGGIAYLHPLLGKRTSRAASVTAVALFAATVLWVSWQTVGNVRDILALFGLMQGLSGADTVDAAAFQAQQDALRRAFAREIPISLFAFFTVPVYLVVAAGRARRRDRSLGQELRASTLPLAAVLTLTYAVHLVAFSVRERAVRAELQQMTVHEGRYIAAKLGQSWPAVSD